MKLLRKMIYYSKSAWEMIRHFKHWPGLFYYLLHGSAAKNYLLQLRRPPVQLMVRSAMDIWSVKETFLDAFYTRYGVSIQDGWTVVDIGAGIGDFSIYAAYDKPNTTIYAYEPFFDSYELFIKNLQLNNIENVNPFQIAVWSTDGELILDASSGEPLQITSRKIDGTSEQGKRDFVQAISLLSILETHAVEKVDLIKMDCEGAEYEVLMKVLPGTFDKIERIIMEYHNLDSDRNYKRLIPFLEDQGYHVRRYKNAVHDHIGFLYAAKG